MITAPRLYAARLAAPLLDAGARVQWLPTIETSSLTNELSQAMLEDALQNLDSFDHVLFTSRIGILAVLKALKKIKGSKRAAICHLRSVAGPRAAAQTTLWALGADAEALSALNIPVKQPEKASTLGLVETLSSSGQLSGKRVLCPIPEVLQPLIEPSVIPKFLSLLKKNNGARGEVIAVPAYETKICIEAEECLLEKILIDEGLVQAIAFSSSAEAQGLVYLLGDGVEENIRKNNIVLAAHGEQTAAGVQAILGLNVHCVNPNPSSFRSYVDALEKHFSQPKYFIG
jgi:uroporphyrinogen-III synthase